MRRCRSKTAPRSDKDRRGHALAKPITNATIRATFKSLPRRHSVRSLRTSVTAQTATSAIALKSDHVVQRRAREGPVQAGIARKLSQVCNLRSRLGTIKSTTMHLSVALVGSTNRPSSSPAKQATSSFDRSHLGGPALRVSRTRTRKAKNLPVPEGRDSTTMTPSTRSLTGTKRVEEP